MVDSDKSKLAYVREHALYFNGGLRYCYEVTKRLSEFYQVDLIVQRITDENEKMFRKEGVDVCDMEETTANKLRYWLLYPYYLLKHSFILRKAQRIYKYDKWISDTPTTHIMCMLAGIKPVIVVMELNPWLYNQAYRKGLSKTKKLIVDLGGVVAKWLEKKAYRNAKRIIVYSKYIQHEVFKTYGVNSEVIYTGVDEEKFHHELKEEIAQKYKNKQIILHVASYLSPMKGTDIAVDVMGCVNQDFPNAQLLIINSDKDTKRQFELSEQAIRVKANIDFISNVSEEDLPSYYSVAKCLLSPSLDFNVHLPVLEAACCETPSVCLQGDCEAEDVEDGFSGIVTKNLAWSVCKLLKDEHKRDFMGQLARFYIAQKFSWDRCVESYKRILSEV